MADIDYDAASAAAEEAMQDEKTRVFFENVAHLMQKSMLDFFLMPLQQQDQIIRAMRPLITENAPVITGYLDHIAEQNTQSHEHGEDCDHSDEETATMEDRMELAHEIIDAVDPGSADDSEE